MKKITDPISLAQKIANEYLACYNSDLISAILYGSAAGATFDPARSDINLLLVLSRMDLPLIEQSIKIQDQWISHRCPRPLFMDKAYMGLSLDTFPIEFLDMKSSYKVLCGEDVLAPITIHHAHLRLQVERELKGKRLHLIQEWLHARQSRRRCATVLSTSIAAFAPTFRAMLFLKREPVPRDRMGVLMALQTAFRFEHKPLQMALEALQAKNDRQACAAFPAFVEAIDRLIWITDNQLTREDV